MRSVPAALMWETFRQPGELLVAALGANLLTVFLFFALFAQIGGAIPEDDPAFLLMHVLLVQLHAACFGAAILAAQGQPRRLYTYPVSSATIVTWHMAPAMLALFCESLLSTYLLNWMFNLHWPLWGPALTLAVAMALTQAMLVRPGFWGMIGWGAAIAAWGIWFKSRYGQDALSMPDHYWQDVTAGEVATMLAVLALAYALGVFHVGRQRRGAAELSLGLCAWLARQVDSIEVLRFRARFRSPAQAQLWMEWTKAWLMPAMVALAMAIGCCGWLLFSRNAEELLQGFIRGGVLLSAAGFVGGFGLGSQSEKGDGDAMGSFLATRPMTSGDLARTILYAAAQAIVLMWLIWALGLLAVYSIMVASGAGPSPQAFSELGWWYLPATMAGAWVAAGVGMVLLLPGRPAAVVGSFGVLGVVGMTWLAGSRYFLAVETWTQCEHGFAIALGVVVVVGTVAAFAAAQRRALIGWTTVAVASSLWLGASGTAALAWAQHSGAPYLLALLLGLASLAVAPLASAPLALHWNRHR